MPFYFRRKLRVFIRNDTIEHVQAVLFLFDLI